MMESEDVAFAEVNCMDSLDTCFKEGIKEYPSIHIYQYGDVLDIFVGDR